MGLASVTLNEANKAASLGFLAPQQFSETQHCQL
jgi:hypothetical protein